MLERSSGLVEFSHHAQDVIYSKSGFRVQFVFLFLVVNYEATSGLVEGSQNFLIKNPEYIQEYISDSLR